MLSRRNTIVASEEVDWKESSFPVEKLRIFARLGIVDFAVYRVPTQTNMFSESGSRAHLITSVIHGIRSLDLVAV